MNFKKLHRNILLMTMFCLFMINKANAQTYTIIEPGPEHYSSKASSMKNATIQSTPINNVNPRNTEQLNRAFNASSNGNGVATQPNANCYIPPDATYTNFPGNDDGSVGPIPLPFTFSLYGVNYTSVYINNNGNLTFTAPYSSFDPVGFPTNIPMVAPFWADVDTRVGNTVKYKVSPTRLIVTWPGVGYYNQNVSKLNTFQVVITNGNDPLIGLGNNVAFYYGDMQWTTGDVASNGGVNGFGGVPATSGINQGDGVNYIQIGRFNANNATYTGPLSLTSGINYLDLGCFPLTAGSLTNLPPSVSGVPPSNTLNIACGETGTINLTALPPEVGQNVSVTIDTGTLCNATIVNATSGTSSNATVSIVGSACNEGSHNISFVFTDNFNPSASTTVNITVVIGTAPVISCPSNIIVSNTPGICSAQVFYPVATATGTTPTFTYSIPSGSNFPLGVTTVTATATNGCGSDSCTFTVTVNDTQVPTITCPDNIVVSNTTNQCGANVSFAATASDNCGTANITYSPASGSFFNIGTTTVTATADDGHGNTSNCTFTVTVNDTQPPVISCPGNKTLVTGPNCLVVLPDYVTTSTVTLSVRINSGTSSTNCFADGGFDFTPEPKWKVNINNQGWVIYPSNGFCYANTPNIQYTQTYNCSSNYPSAMQVCFSAFEDDGTVCVASESCVANICQIISVPDPGESFNYFLSIPSGAPSWGNVSFTVTATGSFNSNCPAATDNCSASVTQSPPPGTLLAPGIHTVTLNATDPSGNTDTCTFNVNVIDTTPPVINCQANITNIIATSASGAVVNYVTPVGADNCSGATTTRIAGLASGSTFPIGTTTVTHRVTNAAGLTAQCSFTVTVIGVAPQISCPANITVNNTENQCGANVSFTATETVGIPASTITYSHASGSFFPEGTTTVTATATNTVGSTSCTFTVTVNDTQPPVINCPGNIDVDLSAGQCGAFVSFAATASDNCGTANITYSHAPGSLFSVGTTTVTATANDGNGNTSSCTFTITVDLLDHVNLQWPPDATICPGGSFTAYGQVYEPNLTTISGQQGANIEVQFGYNTANTNPSGWSNWFAASFNQFGGGPNNDEYLYNFSLNTPGTYYYTFRYRQNGCAWQYGGFKQWDGGTWDGTNNVSGILTVQALDWANLQWPSSSTICQGSSITAYGQVYEAGVTTVPGVRGAGIDVQFGYNTANTNPSGWSNWVTLNNTNFNALGGGSSNDEYMYEFYPPSSGTYYYTFRYRLNGCAWQYGGFSTNGGYFWDGVNHTSGSVNVDPTTVGGNVSGGTSICPGETSALLTLSDYTGLILGWESSTAPFLSWDPISNNNETYTSGPLSETTKFRAIVQSGVCSSATSGETTVIVYLTYPFYADNDEDGYGAGLVQYLCSDDANNPPTGFTVDGTDCDDTLADRHQTFPFYIDGDGDGYGREGSTAVQLCAIDGNTPPESNYSVNDDDCNDGVSAIHPGVYDIPYDNIDNNCDGSLYDGHAPIVVHVLSPSCGGINHGLNNTINCTEIYLGEGYVIGYRFKVTNLTTGEVDYVDTTQHHFKLTDTDIYSYGTPYSIQVAAIVNGEVQPFNGPICTLTTTTVATTKVINSQCGSTLLFMNSTINANAVNSAITYRFRVARADAPTTYYYSGERNLPNFNLTMLTVPVGFLTYATEYKVDVQIKIKLANIIAWSQFGQVCSIFTPTPPTTSIIVSQCELTATSDTQVINATPFVGATAYRFLLTHYDGDGNIDYQQYQDSPTPSFTLSMFTGLLPGTTYNVAVSMQLYGTFVPYDKDCSVTTPVSAKAVIETPFKASAYPNPFAENFMIDVKTSNPSAIDIKVYDMLGRLVEQKSVKINDLETSPFGERYPSGVYNVVVSQGDEVKTLRVVKR